MASTPIVSVVMPAFNAAEFLDEAVSSILDQTFRDFEFITINDGSSDDTPSILERYRKADHRVHVYHQENQGIIGALNRGCRLARGKYIARMDADDISLPHRLERQVDYIERYPEIGILGTWIYKIGSDGSVVGSWCPSSSGNVLKWKHFFGGSTCHPSVLMRRSVLERIDYYRPGSAPIEDEDLWRRASAITDFGNVPEFLFKYRVWNGSTFQSLQKTSGEAQINLLRSFISDFLKTTVPLHAVAGLKLKKCKNLEQVLAAAALLESLYRRFQEANSLTPRERFEISSNAATRMALLAFQALQFKSVKSLSLLIRSVRLNYRLLHPSVIIRNLKQDRLGYLLGRG
jgi:glycosyltransferase involved in cell wall biosynthesis